MLFTFKWMDNLQYIEQHQIIKNCLLFFIFNFTCCKVDQPPSGFSSWGDQDIPLNEGTGEGEGLPASCKVWTFPFCWIKISHTGNFCWIKISHTGKFHILGKKMSQNCCSHQVQTVPPFPETLWVTLGMRKSPTQQPKIYSFVPSEKLPLIDLNLLLSKVSLLPRIKQQFSILQSSFAAAAIFIVYFKFQVLCRHMSC